MPWICPKCRTRFDERIHRCPHDNRRVVADLTGQIVHQRYQLKELLGVGGMDSSVWLAMQQPVNRPVAVKLLPAPDGESADRFARGARIASNLSHPHITVVHDYGSTDQGQLFLVMERLDGRTLHDVLKEGALPVERALHVTDQVLKALDHAHRKKVVHRDIKPGNLFLMTRNEDAYYVKVLDFGIARFIDPDDTFYDEPAQEITTTRQICGTPQYMAPEQIAMGRVDARSDLYALGIVLYRMLTGHLPFNSRDHRELFRAHLTQAPPPFAEMGFGVNMPELEALVMRSLAKAPDDRFASAAEMRTAIRQLRMRLGMSLDDELTPISGAISMPSGMGLGVGMPSHHNTQPIEVGRPRRNLWAPLLLLFIVLLGLGTFVWFRTVADREAVPDVGVTARAPDSAAPDTLPAALVTAPATTPAPIVDAGPPPDAAPPSAAPETAPPEPETGLVHISSAPRGARVIVDGAVLGKTPVTLSLPVGAQRLLLRRGRKVAALRVDVRANIDPPNYHAVLKLRGAASPASAPAKPRVVAPPTASVASAAPEAPETDAAKTVRLQLLDENEARDFKVGAKKDQPAAPSTRAPKIDLLGQ